MKIYAFALFCVLIHGLPSRSIAQDLDDLVPFAHYTLINTSEDALGLQNEMFLVNTVYEGQDGVYFNGLHPTQPGGSYARTYYMEALTDSKFAVQLEFKIDDLDGQFRCVMVCGLSLTKFYLGLFINPEDEFTFLLDNDTYVDVPEFTPDEEEWYEFTMIYDTVSAQAKFYLDGLELANFDMPPDRVQGDAFITNNTSVGYPLNGNWRNLRVFEKEDVSALEDELRSSTRLKIFPNPSYDRVDFTYSGPRASQWRVSNLNGEAILAGAVTDHKGTIDIQELPPGVYVLHILDQAGQQLSNSRFVHMR